MDAEEGGRERPAVRSLKSKRNYFQCDTKT